MVRLSIILLFLCSFAYGQWGETTVPFDVQFTGQLLYWYPQNANTLDSTANNYDLTNYGVTFTTPITGNGTGCGLYNGLSTARRGDVYDGGDVGFSFYCQWAGSTPSTFYASGDSAGTPGILIDMNSDSTIRVYAFNGGGANTNRIKSTTKLIPNTTYFIAYNIDSVNNQYELFINGVEDVLVVSTGANDGDWVDSQSGVNYYALGGINNGGSIINLLSGKIADFRYFSEPQTAAYWAWYYDVTKP